MSLKFSQLGARQTESDIARLMTFALQRPDVLSLAAGFTDNDTLPLEKLTKLAMEIRDEGDLGALQYGSNQGSPDLRSVLARRLQCQDGVDSTYGSDRTFITNGSQQALYLAVQTLCDAGDIVLVEQPTYFVFLEMLRGLGVKAVSMPMRANGDVDAVALALMLKGYAESGDIDRVKAVYLVSYYSNPSGHSVSLDCKKALLELLAAYDGRIALFEDAAYRELYYDRPFEAPSCVALQAARGSVPVFYTTTLTKPFATGLKVGYGYCTDEDWLSRMLAIKGQQDFGTANYNQTLLLKVLTSGLFDEHLRTLRMSYYKKMMALDEVLSQNLADCGWTWERPEGGLYIWASAPPEIETGFDSKFHASAIEEGVMYVPGELCYSECQVKCKARISFGVLRTEQLKQAARRFARAAKRFSLIKTL
ncbi:aminotransferase, classes I and II superfamily [Verrucomicrobiia bacterium DG1235]|nr:aminotransferase, classes I and II superfamily [Verrucomicrobiae bacterium DG1235]